MNASEVLLRAELIKHSPDLLAKFEAERRKEDENNIRSLLGPGGCVRRIGDALIVTPGRIVNVRDPGSGRLLQRESVPARPTPKVVTDSRPLANESDYQKLLVAESKRHAAWHPTARWKENHAELLRWDRLNRRDQVALTVAEMAAEELGIQQPMVRAWRGDEKTAVGKWGWVMRNCLNEINVTLNHSSQDTANTAAHEARHIWQFRHYPNLTTEEREKDANAYAKRFAERVFKETL